MIDVERSTDAAVPDFSDEIFARISVLAKCSESSGFLTRRYLTQEHKRANQHVLKWMEQAGMSARIDALGNVVGRYEGKEPDAPTLILGSHLDTVVNAGRYDGMLGVITPISCIQHLHERGERLDVAIEVVGFGDEEGVRFQATLIGSRAMAGTFNKEMLELQDSTGMSMHDALLAFGLDPNKTDLARRSAKDVVGYVELHIEQGPVLEAEQLPVGVVSSIAGATRLSVQMQGEAGHAGTVPMSMRKDALAGAAEALLLVESRCSEDELVGTVGRLTTTPGAVNVIPGDASFSVDIRSGDDSKRERAVIDVRTGMHEIAVRRNLHIEIAQTHATPSCQCSGSIMTQLETAIAREQLRPLRLPSGAGHDAMAMAAMTEVGMLFVRCRKGISHHPDESMTQEDAATAAKVLLRFLRDYKEALR